MRSLISVVKDNRYIQIALALSLIVIVVFILFGTNNATSAQEGYAGQEWEYLEINFNTPVTFGDNVSAGYFINGNFTQQERTDVLVKEVIRFYGNNGWELVTTSNNQIFVFKRPVQ